jgi:hypothetical protein
MRKALMMACGAAALLCAAPAAAQSSGAAAPAKAAAPASKAGWKAPRNIYGQPDLSGAWTNATLTPLTRNPRVGAKATLTEEEAQAFEKVWAAALAESNEATDPNASTQEVQKVAEQSELLKIRPDFAAAGGDVGGYNTFWLDPGTRLLKIDGAYRSSILTTPNGMPPKAKANRPTPPRMAGMEDRYDSYEVRSHGDRCIAGFGRNAGPPMLPNGYYNNGYEIVQTADNVAILVEMIHDVRNIRLNAKHRTDGMRPYMGDSVGRWEGDTLVVETINLPESQAFMGSWKNLKVTERFTRISPTEIRYAFEVSDPDTWDAPWGGEYVFHPYGGVYEYACHEGNYALPGILAGARQAEKEAAAKASGARTSAPGAN